MKKNKHLLFDVVMSNPPFAGDIQEKTIINLYSDILGYRYNFKIDTGRIKSLLATIAFEYNIKWTEEVEKLVMESVKEINKDTELDLEQEEDQHAACQLIGSIMVDNVLDGVLSEVVLIPRLRELINFKKNESKSDKVDRHILFIERVLDMLKEGGRAVIVLPQGIFNNSNEKYVRKFITSRARILAVVGLHGNSFKPHTGTKTSLLFLRKYRTGEIVADYPIFFATSKVTFKDNSGEYLYLTDDKGEIRFDEDHNPIYQSDLPMIAEAFEDWAKKQLTAGDKAFDYIK